MNCIDDLYFGNLEPQELNAENSTELKKKLKELVLKEDKLTSLLLLSKKNCFLIIQMHVMSLQA